jgi:tRNA modification GTPase
MSYHPDDTICAIATAPGGAARGIVRISGARAMEVAGRVFQAMDGKSLGDVTRATTIVGHATVQLHGVDESPVPCDAYLWPTARSYTREPVAELHTIGSPPVLEAIVAQACRAGARLAEPGEFTLRAFLAGRIDLTQAEAVLGVIDAHTHNELDAALTQLAGGLARPLQSLRDELLQLLAELEAGLDFVDEDIEFVSREALLSRLKGAGELLREIEAQTSSRATTENCAQVVLMGAPNAGKSSLFNALAARYGSGDDAITRRPSTAIVSPQRGTTRDYLTASVNFRGIRCMLVDTAGVEETPHKNDGDSRAKIEAAAQMLAAERRQSAAVRVCCIDVTDVTTKQDAAEIASNFDIVAFTKSDLLTGPPTRAGLSGANPIATSSRTGEGIDALCEMICARLAQDHAGERHHVISSTAERCRDSVRLAGAAIDRASGIATEASGDELVAAELRVALAELGKVVGAVYTDDMLDRIFSTFCIGK